MNTPQTVGERIYKIRKEARLTQAEFAKEFGISTNYVGQLELGKRNPGPRLIKDICSAYQIRVEWAETGNGPMHLEPTREDRIAKFFSDVLSGDNGSFRYHFISALARLEEKDWENLADMVERMAAENEKKPGD